MKEMDQVNEQNLESVAGGNGYGTAPVFMTVANLQSGYLALRNATYEKDYDGNSLSYTAFAFPILLKLLQVFFQLAHMVKICMICIILHPVYDLRDPIDGL